MPGTPGGYNPGGGGGYGTYPWLSFIMLPGGLYGAKLATPLAKPIVGLLGRQLITKPLHRGLPTPGALGLYQQYTMLGDLRAAADIINLGRLISSGGGGPGESPTSTDSPPGLQQQGQPVPVVVPAASISAHGGRRSGSKPRKRCPPGYKWSDKYDTCVSLYSYGARHRKYRKG